MKIPKTTEDKPYIEFRFDKKGKMKLSATNKWWGGKNSGFHSSDGSEGNTCEPKHLEAYIEAFKKRKINSIEKEIILLQKEKEKIKKINYDWNIN
jgi:hypothetical protein